MKIKIFKITEPILTLTVSIFLSTPEQVAPLTDREFSKWEIRAIIEKEQKEALQEKRAK